ncbi:MAG: hypothetical protein IJ998_02390, partial [Alistipes sp.]|nr:hypothetical protein [Alistipes sp.]
VRGHGMPTHRGGYGDLYIDVAINIPTKLTDKQKKILNEFAGATMLTYVEYAPLVARSYPPK